MREWLYEIRKKEQKSQQAVASAAGISQSYYANIERGTRGLRLSVPTAIKIASALNFDWKLFYEDVDVSGAKLSKNNSHSEASHDAQV